MPHPFATPLLALLVLIAPAANGVSSAATTDAETQADTKTLNLQSRIGDLELVREDDQLRVQHNGHTLSAEQYLTLIETQQGRRDAGGPWFAVFNITTGFGVLWVALGLLGQLLFTGRMLVQWIASEKQKRSVVPPIFWHMSLAGATMLLVYFVWRKDIVGVLGQSTGWAIYARNVYLIRKHHADATRSNNSEHLAPGQ